MPPSKLDAIYRRLLITRFFEKGWGKPENLQRLFEFRKIVSNRQTCYKLVPQDYPIEITKTEKFSDYTLLDGHFTSPFELHLPGLIPKEAQTAYFQVVVPNTWKSESYKPMCIHLAGTGDHYFWRRRNFLAKPLMRQANIGAIILENPFYGERKPGDQVRSNLHNVSDIFVMGGCLILESIVLLNWCEKNGFGPLGLTGLSMGGHMASLAATNWPKPIVLVPCLSWTTAASTFTQGVMSQSINWDMLETQYFSDGKYRERLSKMVTIVDDAFMAGQKFAKNFNQSMEELKTDIDCAKTLRNSCSDLIVAPNKKDNIMKLDARNSFGLVDEIKEKLKTNKSHELNNVEIEKINQKIKITQDKLRFEIQFKEFLKNPNMISRDIFNPPNRIGKMEENSENIIEEKINTEKKNDSTIVEISIEQKEESALTKLMKYILPVSALQSRNENTINAQRKWWEREALQFMRGVMDECTHLKNFSVPYDTSLIIAVCAKDDAYIPRDGCSNLEDIWPGVEVRYLDAGHVSAYVLHQKLFRSCIIEAFERAKKKAERENHVDDCENLTPTLTFKELKERYDRALLS